MTSRRSGDADIDRLYSVPLADFTRRRNELAARLRDAGRRDDAAAVRRLTRPSAAVWAINGVARENAEMVRTFVAATERLRRAQRGTRDAVMEATRAQRRALQELARATERILERGGLRATTTVRERVSRTLLGTATDPDSQRALLRGRLTEERDALGFEALAGATIGRAVYRQSEAPGTSRRGRATQERRASAAREARTAAEARAHHVERTARALEERAAAEEGRAQRTARTVADLRQQLRQAEARAREQLRAARSATSAAKRGRQEAVRAAARARRAGSE